MKDDVRARMIAFLPRLHRFAFALTGDWDQTEDLVQDTCERTLARIDQWRPGTELESWMFRIAQNLWKDGAKRKKVRGEVTGVDVLEQRMGTDGRHDLEMRLTLGAVIEMIGQLPKEQQLLIALVCIDGRSYKEASEILEIPIGTVMSRLGRARQALYDAINDGAPKAGSSGAESRREQGR